MGVGVGIFALQHFGEDRDLLPLAGAHEFAGDSAEALAVAFGGELRLEERDDLRAVASEGEPLGRVHRHPELRGIRDDESFAEDPQGFGMDLGGQGHERFFGTKHRRGMKKGEQDQERGGDSHDGGIVIAQTARVENAIALQGGFVSPEQGSPGLSPA